MVNLTEQLTSGLLSPFLAKEAESLMNWMLLNNYRPAIDSATARHLVVNELRERSDA